MTNTLFTPLQLGALTLPNRILMAPLTRCRADFSAWTSCDDARRFFESPELVKIRAEAGVKSPDFIYLDQLEAGIL